MLAKTILGLVAAAFLVCSIGVAGEKAQKKASKDVTGCCAEMTKASSSDAKACEGKDMKTKGGASAGCCEQGTKARASAGKSAEAPKVSAKDKK